MHNAFTLIELLVVITIIVVLLSLMTPALDKAIYQAELAVCAANLKGIATASQVYASGNRRAYPRRTTLEGGGTCTEQLNWGGVDDPPTRDDRPLLATILSINKNLIDPFCEPTDLTHTDIENGSYASYALWFGWAYDGQAGMKKLGD